MARGMTGKKHSEETKQKIREARLRQKCPKKGKRLNDEQIQTLRDTSFWRGRTSKDHSKSIESCIVYKGKLYVKDSCKDLAKYMSETFGLPYSGVSSGWKSNGISKCWQGSVEFVGTYENYLKLYEA